MTPRTAGLLALALALTPSVSCRHAAPKPASPPAAPTAAPTPEPPKYDAIVALDGSGDFTTVQAAIDAAPDTSAKWHTIFIKKGRYRQVLNIPAKKSRLRLVGEDAMETVLTYDHCSTTAGGTGASSSTFVPASDFVAENLWFENAFDFPNAKPGVQRQAVALQAMGDRQVYKKCRFTGYQDTLYVRAGRKYFKDCYIAGSVDFVFGDGTAVFDGCRLHSVMRGNAILAASTPEATAHGLVFVNTAVTADPATVPAGSVYLGRPWHPSSETAPVRSMAWFVGCELGAHVHPDGWSGSGNTKAETERFAEYRNTGPGATVKPSRPQLSDAEGTAATALKILAGSDGWDPTKL